jgi:hypothetical protein
MPNFHFAGNKCSQSLAMARELSKLALLNFLIIIAFAVHKRIIMKQEKTKRRKKLRTH